MLLAPLAELFRQTPQPTGKIDFSFCGKIYRGLPPKNATPPLASLADTRPAGQAIRPRRVSQAPPSPPANAQANWTQFVVALRVSRGEHLGTVRFAHTLLCSSAGCRQHSRAQWHRAVPLRGPARPTLGCAVASAGSPRALGALRAAGFARSQLFTPCPEPGYASQRTCLCWADAQKSFARAATVRPSRRVLRPACGYCGARSERLRHTL